jgi:hypothetical protein
MRWQRRLSAAFAATGHPALRPHSLARTSQMAGPLGEIRLLSSPLNERGSEMNNSRVQGGESDDRSEQIL